MSIFNNTIVFKPIISLGIVLPYIIILMVIVILNRKHIINRALILLLVLIISQRPMLKDKDEITYNLNFDILFVIDNTVSMNAEDANGRLRLDAVKRDCKQIIKEFAGSNFAIITYANIAQVKYPYTTELATIEDIIDRMKVIDPNYATGSSLDLPYDYMQILLESSSKKEKHKRIVFFIGDGELTKNDNSSDLTKYQKIKDLINGGAVLGYGTAEGAKVKIYDSIVLNKVVDSNGYLLDGKTMQPAISKMNENNLKKIANNLGVNYYHMVDSSKLKTQIEAIKQEVEEEENDDEEKLDKDIYYYFSGALLILLLIELFHYRIDEQ